MATCFCCLCVHQNEVAILQQFGKFKDAKAAGFSFVPCCIGVTVAGVVSTRVRQLEVSAETKTKDNVFVTLRISVQYQIAEGEAYKAFYKLTDPHRQITAYVSDVIRSSVPKLNIDEVFETKQEIAHAVRNELCKTMAGLGFIIKEALVTDIDPDPRVKDAMNEINAAQRMRMAAVEKAEAEKILAVKDAEANAESKHLAGIGIARQRKAIADGLRDSVVAFTGNVHGASAQDVMSLMLVTQYFDTIKELGEHSRSSTIFLPHSPGAVADIARQIHEGTGIGGGLGDTAHAQLPPEAPTGVDVPAAAARMTTPAAAAPSASASPPAAAAAPAQPTGAAPAAPQRLNPFTPPQSLL